MLYSKTSRPCQTGRPRGFSTADGLSAAIAATEGARTALSAGNTKRHETPCGLGSPRSGPRSEQQPYHANGARAATPAGNAKRHETTCGLGSPRSEQQPSHANGARAATPAGNAKRHETTCGLGSPRSQRNHLTQTERGRLRPPKTESATQPRADLAVRAPV